MSLFCTLPWGVLLRHIVATIKPRGAPFRPCAKSTAPHAHPVRTPMPTCDAPTRLPHHRPSHMPHPNIASPFVLPKTCHSVVPRTHVHGARRSVLHGPQAPDRSAHLMCAPDHDVIRQSDAGRQVPIPHGRGLKVARKADICTHPPSSAHRDAWRRPKNKLPF
jgi:hypothetical protein